jgi:hypothetical protein
MVGGHRPIPESASRKQWCARVYWDNFRIPRQNVAIHLEIKITIGKRQDEALGWRSPGGSLDTVDHRSRVLAIIRLPFCEQDKFFLFVRAGSGSVLGCIARREISGTYIPVMPRARQ